MELYIVTDKIIIIRRLLSKDLQLITADKESKSELKNSNN
jgi:hypothetical protein